MDLNMLKKALFTWLTMASVSLTMAAVNINTASADELDKQLTGIGPAKAQAIVDFRQKNGPFKTVDDLTKVPGIKEATVNKLRSQATVDGATTGVKPNAVTNSKPIPATK